MTCYPWTPQSWTQKVPYQLPHYKHADNLQECVNTLSKQSPLIFAGEADDLKKKLHEVSQGRRFMITGGDCAETFDDFSPTKVKEDLQLLMQMSLICGFSGGMKTLQIGRMAGQFAKPRSSPIETYRNRTVHAYRGDIINDISLQDRTPDPKRMIQAYHQSSQTLNLLRAFIQGGYTKIATIKNWRLDKMKQDGWYLRILQEIEQALCFFQSFRYDHDFRLDDFFVGHECLLLPYESALTRMDTISGKYYDCSGHFMWLGERTRQLDSAQVEFLRGVHNPIGIKVSHQWHEHDILQLLDVLDPYREPGKITIITRMGHQNIYRSLPPLIRTVQSSQRNVVWCCDPMHGNTFTVGNRKTRSFNDVKMEIDAFFGIHALMETVPGGIHLEMTSRNVTECIGGNVDGIKLDDISSSYESKCDPRLNGIQALEIAFLIGEKLRQRHRSIHKNR